MRRLYYVPNRIQLYNFNGLVLEISTNYSASVIVKLVQSSRAPKSTELAKLLRTQEILIRSPEEIFQDSTPEKYLRSTTYSNK